ncbi:hypothetical protein GCM10009092_37540 [Bowmanella denitrificans]|uniref:N-acetyltransferase domain-containing protein n=2 Tax=Bowmanella denitrificans TaxID=366582 RepID=A0ABN0XPU0_9ALTE
MSLCEWATPFQSPQYILTWFNHYQDFSPLALIQEDEQGQLSALLVMARHHISGRLVVAGDHQAEYQCWICRKEHQDVFISLALQKLLENQPLIAPLRIRYIPSRVPLDCVKTGALQDVVEFVTHKRPLLKIDSEEIENSFRKKSNKSRFNRLKKHGELSFKLLHTRTELEQYLDAIIAQYDLRQGANNNSFPFLEDSAKKAFHLDLFESYPNMFHNTVTLIDNVPIAAHIGVVGRDQIHLAILAHSPFFADHSPGKLHIMQLSRDFAENNIACLDLTPGGDLWKERFANDHDQVTEIRIYPSKATRDAANAKQIRLNRMKSLAGNVGISPSTVRVVLSTMKKLTPRQLFTRLGNMLPRTVEMRFYRHTPESAARVAEKSDVAVNKLADMLTYRSGQGLPDLCQFSSQCLNRFEQGEVSYSIRIDGVLAHCGWMIKYQKESLVSEIGASYCFPDNSAVLYDFCSDPEVRGKGLYQKTIKHMLADTERLADAKYVYISVRADNKVSRHVIEKLGFEYQESLFRFSCLGFERHWRK